MARADDYDVEVICPTFYPDVRHLKVTPLRQILHAAEVSYSDHNNEGNRLMSNIRTGAVKLKGNPVDLAGPALAAGGAAPEFTLQGLDLSDVTLANSAGKVRIIATVPSLDTPTCHKETKLFNDKAKTLPNVQVLCVSMDLPFGQKRWCGSEGVENVACVSAHRCTKFGEDYGVLIKGGPLDRCLARAIFVIGADNKIKHVEYVSEIANEPNYDAALAAAK
jgi:thiol peroxidase